jgi:hypothetical protein
MVKIYVHLKISYFNNLNPLPCAGNLYVSLLRNRRICRSLYTIKRVIEFSIIH